MSIGSYDVQQVCLNGHQITDSFYAFSNHRRSYCNICGAETIHKCPKCQHDIKGRYEVPGVVAVGFPTPIPDYCENCGKPFPWTEKINQIVKQVESDNHEDPLKLIEHIFEKFHLVVRQLRSRHNNRTTLDVSDEYDVQDLLHSLLVLFFEDIRAEEWTPSYAGRSARMDFLLMKEEIVIEVKMTRKGLGSKELGEQLIIDIARYRAHPNCKTLFCFVYDPEGRIANARGIENDLNHDLDDFKVKVLIVPKGY